MSTVDHAEISQFDAHAYNWWDEKGPFSPLHRMNPVRLQFMHNTLATVKNGAYTDASLLDIGCGGGLITEPFARLGMNVTGLDAAPETIRQARTHAYDMLLEITYVNDALENFNPPQKFDIVSALEIVEHVADLELFITHCHRMLKPNGVLFLSTLNRTIQSYIEAIFMAELVLKWIPRGTHTWNKFLRPSTLCHQLEKHGLRAFAMAGFAYNPLEKSWRLEERPHTNYILAARRS